MVYMDMDILDKELKKVDTSKALQTQKDIEFMVNVLACDKETLENCSETDLINLYAKIDLLMNIISVADIPDAEFQNIDGIINNDGGFF